MTEPDPDQLADRLAAVESQLAELRGQLVTTSTTASMAAHGLDALETQLTELATTPPPAPATPAAGTQESPSANSAAAAAQPQQQRTPLTLPELHRWVGEHLLPVRQPLVKTGRAQPTGLRWCPAWHRHPEAVARLAALAESHRAMRAERAESGPGHIEATWWRDLADPIFRELTGDAGPFAACSPSSHSNPAALTHTPLDEYSAPLPGHTGTAAQQEFSIWWLPPELLGPDFPDGSWSISAQTDRDDPPVYGDGLADGPREVSHQWLTEQITASPHTPAAADVQLEREEDDVVTTGDNAQITAPRYTATFTSP